MTHVWFFPLVSLAFLTLPLLPAFPLFQHLNSLYAQNHAGYKERLTDRLRKDDRNRTSDHVRPEPSGCKQTEGPGLLSNGQGLFKPQACPRPSQLGYGA